MYNIYKKKQQTTSESPLKSSPKTQAGGLTDIRRASVEANDTRCKVSVTLRTITPINRYKED